MNETAGQPELLDHLIADMRAHWQRGENALAEAYVELHPELKTDDALLSELVLAEFRLSWEFGGEPDRDEYFRRFPRIAGTLADLLPFQALGVVQAIDVANPFPTQESDSTHLARSESQREHSTRSLEADLASNVAAAKSASRLGRFAGYELLEEIARGGMGIVYKARQIKANRTVALKMILAGNLASLQEVKRFETEASAAATLDHPNIVPIFEVGEHEGRHFYSMGFVDGQSLSDLLRHGPLPPREAARLTLQVTLAVAYAHARGIIHRDLKPQNILLSRDGTTPRVADFGLAKQLAGGSDLTATGQILGTPNFMSPEQARGDTDAVGPVSDVYSLGAVLYCMLTARPPFQAANVIETLRQVGTQEPVSPRLLNAGVDRDLETITLKCLQKEVSRRYGSADELAGDLDRFLAAKPICARPIGRNERIWRWCRRNPLAASLGAAAAVLLLVSAIGGTTLAVIATQYARQADQNATESDRNANLASDAAAKADSETIAAQQLLAVSYLDRGIRLAEEGEAGSGTLWMVQALDTLSKSQGTISTRNSQSDRSRAAETAGLVSSIHANLGAWRHLINALCRVFPNEGPVTFVAYSPDGRTVLTASHNQTARLWNAATGEPIGAPLRHQSSVRAAIFNPDGKSVVTGSWDKTARLWDAATGKPIGAPLQHQGQVLAVACSPDGKTILTGCSDATARLWSMATGKPIGAPLRHRGKVLAIAYSSDGKSVLTGSDDHTAQLWETATGKPIGVPLQHKDRVRVVAYSPDGKRLLTASDDKTARQWNAATGTQIGGPLRHRSGLLAAAYSPDGRMMLTGSGDSTAQLWDAASGQPAAPPLRHRGMVFAVAFSPDGKKVLTGSSDGTARFWETATGRPTGSPLHHRGFVSSVAYSPDGETVLTGASDGAARLWDAAAARPAVAPLSVLEVGYPTFFSPDGKTVLTAWDGSARLLDLSTGTPIAAPFPTKIRCAAFSGDSKTILIGSDEGAVRLWDAATGKPVGAPIEHLAARLRLAISSDGRTALIGSGTTCRLWNVATGMPVGASLEHQGAVFDVAYAPDGRTVLTGSGDQTARLWDVATGKLIGTPLQHRGEVVAVTYSRDGKTILTGSVDCTARLWDAATGKPIGVPLVHQSSVGAVAFSPDGATVLTGSLDGTARLWDTAGCRPVGAPLQHQTEVAAVAYAPDGKTLLTASIDKIARRWACPVPLEGSLERIVCWLRLITNMELDEGGALRILDGEEWLDCRRRLQVLGGRPPFQCVVQRTVYTSVRPVFRRDLLATVDRSVQTGNRPRHRSSENRSNSAADFSAFCALEQREAAFRQNV